MQAQASFPAFMAPLHAAISGPTGPPQERGHVITKADGRTATLILPTAFIAVAVLPTGGTFARFITARLWRAGLATARTVLPANLPGGIRFGSVRPLLVAL